MNLLRPLLVMGTRPEAIKMAPVVHACRRHALVSPWVCFTGQHRELLARAAGYFGVEPQFDLNLMQPGQPLEQFAGRCLEALGRVIAEQQPDCVVAQGDTTSTWAASVAAFYRGVPFVHVEAGLRTGDMTAPWPEEYHRRAVAMTAALHCAPTESAAANLISEGVPRERVIVTGNTVVDSLKWTLTREKRNGAPPSLAALNNGSAPDVVLFTSHRRENFGPPLAAVCDAIRRLSDDFPQVAFAVPVHPNPQVHLPIHERLQGRENIHLTPPLDYPQFVWLMDRCRFILTDSGGVQEEAPTLGKPVLITRHSTERPEAVAAGCAEIVGPDAERILRRAGELLKGGPDGFRFDRNPFGDGKAAERIVEEIVARRSAA